MIKFGQAYNQFNNYTIGNKNSASNKTEEDAVDTPKGTPTKTELNIGRGEESRQWTDPKDGGETLAEYTVRIGDTSTFGNYMTAYESIYNRPLREDDENRDTRNIYGIAGLRAYGITNANIINTYFDKREIDMGVIKQGVISDGIGYSLKTDIVINGKEITTIEELVEALGIKSDTKTEDDAVDTPKGTTTKTELNISKSDEDRQWTDPKDGGETLGEYLVRIGDTSTFGNYMTAYESIYNRPLREDDENRDTRNIYGIAGLRAYGITNANIINTYFDKREIDMGVIKQGVISDGIGYSLKTDIVINGKEITTIEELVEALGIKSE